MDMSQYQDLFFEEAAEHLQGLNQNLLALENNPERLELLDAIFRAAHTLKGMAATMGYDHIAKLTHEMENTLDRLRDGKLDLQPQVINDLFKSADTLEYMVGSIREGKMTEVERPGLPGDSVIKDGAGAEMMNAGNGQQGFNGLNEYEINLINAAGEKGVIAWQIDIKVDPGCIMKSVRAFMVFRNLELIGEVIKAIPPVQDIEDEKFDDGFTVFLLTDRPEEEIRQKLSTITEVSLARLEKVNMIEVEKEEKKEDTNSRPLEESVVAQPEKKQKVHQTVRVDINRLDNLMSLVGELVINKTRLEKINQETKISGLNETIEQINRITTDLQTVVQNVRMVAIEQVFNRFPRMVRDLARELGKEVNFIIEGKETELDRTVIDEIGDPLVHLIRNALDHGLELPEERVALKKRPEGLLKLQAKQEGNHVIISVEDDGKGINLENIKKKAVKIGLLEESQLESLEESALLNLIFEPGFSTAQAVTDLSGRGVGLDVVKSKIQSLSGNVYVETKAGQGTRFVVKLPLTLAIIQALMVKVQDEVFAIPLANIDETTSLDHAQVKHVQGQEVVVLRGKVLPLVFLRELLEVTGEKAQESMYVVVVRKGEQQVGLVVDELIGQQETVINSLGKLLSGLPGVAGATILGDGSVSLILDIGTLY